MNHVETIRKIKATDFSNKDTKFKDKEEFLNKVENKETFISIVEDKINQMTNNPDGTFNYNKAFELLNMIDESGGGGGDVYTNKDNVFTGTNTFNGATTTVNSLNVVQNASINKINTNSIYNKAEEEIDSLPILSFDYENHEVNVGANKDNRLKLFGDSVRPVYVDTNQTKLTDIALLSDIPEIPDLSNFAKLNEDNVFSSKNTFNGKSSFKDSLDITNTNLSGFAKLNFDSENSAYRIGTVGSSDLIVSRNSVIIGDTAKFTNIYSRDNPKINIGNSSGQDGTFNMISSREIKNIPYFIYTIQESDFVESKNIVIPYPNSFFTKDNTRILSFEYKIDTEDFVSPISQSLFKYITLSSNGIVATMDVLPQSYLDKVGKNITIKILTSNDLY